MNSQNIERRASEVTFYHCVSSSFTSGQITSVFFDPIFSTCKTKGQQLDSEPLALGQKSLEQEKYFLNVLMISTNAGVNMPGTEVLLMKNYPKPKTCSCWEGRNGSDGIQ